MPYISLRLNALNSEMGRLLMELQQFVTDTQKLLGCTKCFLEHDAKQSLHIRVQSVFDTRRNMHRCLDSPIIDNLVQRIETMVEKTEILISWENEEAGFGAHKSAENSGSPRQISLKNLGSKPSSKPKVTKHTTWRQTPGPTATPTLRNAMRMARQKKIQRAGRELVRRVAVESDTLVVAEIADEHLVASGIYRAAQIGLRENGTVTSYLAKASWSTDQINPGPQMIKTSTPPCFAQWERQDGRATIVSFEHCNDMCDLVDRSETEAPPLVVSLADDDQRYGTLCVRLPEGVPVGDEELQILTEIGEDITIGLRAATLKNQKRNTDQTIALLEQENSIICENAPEFCFILSNNGTIARMNLAARTELCPEENDLLSKRLSHLCIGQSTEHLEKALIVGSSSGKVENIPLKIRDKNGSQLEVLFNMDTVRDENGGELYTMAVLRDQTELKSYQEQLLHSQRMEGMGQMAGGVAHDFNNLLSVIIGRAECAQERLVEDDPMRRYIQPILSASVRAASLTRQLLAFSRKESMEPSILSINELVAEFEKLLGRVIGENIALRTSLPPELGNVRANPGQMEQVVMNLAVNARDAMPSGGDLTIQTEHTELSVQSTELCNEAKPGHYIVLNVTDTGHGMSEEVKARIFEPFYTTKGESRGTGLGLATVYGIVKQHGGFIRVASELNQGTSIGVYLPLVEESETHATSESKPIRELFGKETILVVEDEETVLEITHLMLESAGYIVVTATSGAEALKAFDSHKGRIDLVLTDIVLPKMSGRVLSEQLKTRVEDIKIVFMSGYANDTLERHGPFRSNAFFIAKPFRQGELLQKVRAVLDNQDETFKPGQAV